MKKKLSVSSMLGLASLALVLSLAAGCELQKQEPAATSVAPLTEGQEGSVATPPEAGCSGNCAEGCTCKNHPGKGCSGQCDKGCTCPHAGKPGGCDGNCAEGCTCKDRPCKACDGNCAGGCTCKKECTCAHHP